ncbi:uncharacterized protein V6R79_018187, partial [Siganus canaliculatus]
PPLTSTTTSSSSSSSGSVSTTLPPLTRDSRNRQVSQLLSTEPPQPTLNPGEEFKRERKTGRK